MEWIKWNIDTLPPVGERVLIDYRSGFGGAIEFFNSQEHKDNYIKGMRGSKENPNAEMGIIGSWIKELDESDPIIAWMLCPKPPVWN